MSVKRKCVCCGKEYDYCPNCAKKEQPAWMVSFCSEPCKELFNIVSAYNAKRIGKAAVQAFVAEHHVAGTNYTEAIQRALLETQAPKEVAPVSKWDIRREENLKPAEEPRIIEKASVEAVPIKVTDNKEMVDIPLRQHSRKKRRRNRM